jgi:hypothetical protein
VDEDGFVRQRRNIIVASVLLLFADALGFKFSQINIFGNIVILAEPVRVTPFLWAAWIYLLLRYWQAFREHGGESFTAFTSGNLGRSTTDYALSEAQRRLANTANVIHNENGPIVGIDELSRKGLYARARLTYQIQEGQGGAARKNIEFPISRHRMIWFYIKACLVATFNRSIVSEKYLPFGFAAAPLIYLLYSSVLEAAKAVLRLLGDVP